MSEFNAKVFDYIDKYHMLEECDNLFIGVSGGADSVCLTMILKDYIEQRGLNIKLCGVHVNHGIRKEAVKDEEFSKAFLKQLGIECKTVAIDAIGFSKANGLSLEEGARLKRYEVFYSLAGTANKAKIAVAHHMNDQAETVLMNMARGSSLKGISGIKPVRDNIIRPLLGVTREEIEEYLNCKNQTFVTDNTNLDNTYTRNSIRNVVLPYLSEHVNSNAVSNISRAASSVNEAFEYIDYQAGKVLDKIGVVERTQRACEENKEGRIFVEANISVEAKILLSEPRIIRRRVIYRIIQTLSQASKDIYENHVDSVEVILNSQTGKRADLCYGITVVKDYDRVVFYRDTLDKQCVKANVSKGNYKAVEEENAFSLPIDISELIENTGSVIEVPVNRQAFIAGKGLVMLKSLRFYENNIKSSSSDYIKIFDYGKINHSLSLRTRRVGDYLVISSDGERKKLKKELIDRKIPQACREDCLLLCDGQEVIWAVGVRRGESSLVDNDTKHIMCVELIFTDRR